MSCPPSRPCVPPLSQYGDTSGAAMSRVAQRRIDKDLQRPEWPPGAVIGGVDTHKHVHVAAACDPLGRVLGTREFPTTTAGVKALLRFLRSHGQLAAVGVEGTGCWGGGLARFLTARDVTVIEVDRPNRQARRRRGKSDTIDAEEAARSVIAGRARTIPKTGTGPVEMARQLRVPRRAAQRAAPLRSSGRARRPEGRPPPHPPVLGGQ